MKRTVVFSAKNCDVIHAHGYSTDGVFGILTGDSFVQAYCEFDREGQNWMVSEQLEKQDLKSSSRLKRLTVSNSSKLTNDNYNHHFLLRILKLHVKTLQTSRNKENNLLTLLKFSDIIPLNFFCL